MGQQPALELTGTGRAGPAAGPEPAAGIDMMPRALVDAARAMGVELSGKVEKAAGILVAGTLAPGTRYRYGYELSEVARWCDEHGLSLLSLSPLDVAALLVARRNMGKEPRSMLAAIAFVYRHMPGGPVDIAGLARRVDRVWKAKYRDVRPPIRRAAVLPLQCWVEMREAIGSKEYAQKDHGLLEERLARDRLMISLCVAGGLRPGEPGRISASASRIDEMGRLVLPLVPEIPDSTTKTGQVRITVPVAAAPFDAFPLAEDFEKLRALRLARGDGDDYLFGNAYHYNTKGGVNRAVPPRVWQRAARIARIAGADMITGYSARRSMVHIAAAAGWSLDQIAAVTAHANTDVLERAYLDGYGGTWVRSAEGQQMLLRSTDGWEDCAANWAPGFDRGPSDGGRPWWSGRDLDEDRAEAERLARCSPRVSRMAPAEIALIGRRWEAFCEENGTDPAEPTKTLLEMFALDFCKDKTSKRNESIRYLADWFASLPSTDLGRIPEISGWVMEAARVGGRTVKVNRRRAGAAPAGGPRSRGIVPVTEDDMEALFAVPLVKRQEATRLVGLAIAQGIARKNLPEPVRLQFRFGEHTRIHDNRALLFDPRPARNGSGPGGLHIAYTVFRRDIDPLWSGYEAVKKLAAHYPDKTLKTHYRPGPRTARCKPLVRWLQSRAAVAVLYATGLRPTDIEGFRWPDLKFDADGNVMWRLPYSKGNPVGDQMQVLRIERTGRPWCPVAALEQLASALIRVPFAGWEEDPVPTDSDGVVRRVFPARAGTVAHLYLIEPAGLDIRPQDFRYRMAAKVWTETLDIQMVRSALFHSSEAVSMRYVSRGLPNQVRAELDPLAGLYRGD